MVNTQYSEVVNTEYREMVNLVLCESAAERVNIGQDLMCCQIFGNRD